MSLLLEALKKAELAKQSAATPAPVAVEPVITRDTLPDISRALEIEPPEHPEPAKSAGPSVFDAPATVIPPLTPLTEPPAPEPIAAPAPTERPRIEPSFTPDPVPGISTAPNSEAERAAARQIFEAKENDYNPKRPFYITLGVLGLFAAGYAGYVWWQLQPKTVYNTAAVSKPPAQSAAGNVPPPAPAPAGEQAAAPPAAPATPQAQTAAAPAPPAVQAPGTPQAQGATVAPTPTAAPPAAAAKTAKPAAAAPAIAARAGTAAGGAPQPRVATRSPSARSAASKGEEKPAGTSPIAVNPAVLLVDPQIELAYAAFQRGDLGTARTQYQATLQRDPTNRDALLGLAAIDMRTRNFDLAESRYLRLLEMDPRDTHAQAGIIALRGQTDPVQSESRLKTLIAQQPDAAHLHFALGNQYSVQSRWPEAQSAYFKAYSLDPENPDFAFNLAVSLDHLRQARVALDYYRRALALGNARAASFDRAQVTTRINELSR